MIICSGADGLGHLTQRAKKLRPIRKSRRLRAFAVQFSRRSPVIATNGMVATSQPLAAMAGLRMLMQGGNAVDGAVAAAAALNVVEPMSTGIGGDLFALVWNASDKGIRALNASGRAPAAADLEELRGQGHTHISSLSPHAVTVPGCVDGWHTLIEECGAMSLIGSVGAGY